MRKHGFSGAFSSVRLQRGRCEIDIYNVSAGVVSSGVTLARFDEMNVLSGGAADGISVGGGADLYVRSGASASGSVIGSGGGAFVTGAAQGDIVNAGGFEYVVGGVAAFSEVNSGATERLSLGGTAEGTQLQPGAVQQALAGTAIYDATVGSGAYQFVSSGGTVLGTTVESGGFQEVLSGGIASASTIESGGYLVALPGAVVTSAVLEPGGMLISAGIVFNPNPPAVVLYTTPIVGLQVGVSASDYVLSGGLASKTTVFSGGQEFVDAGGVVSGSALRNGGTETVSGGVAYDSTVSGGVPGVYSLQDVTAAGMASGTKVFIGGAQNVSGGSAMLSVLSGGAQFVEAGGAVTGTTIAAGGYQFIGAGGTATATVVSSGGSQNVSGGAAYGTTQMSGGRDFVAFGGVLSGAVLSGDASFGPGGTGVGATVYDHANLTVDGGTVYGSQVQSGGLQVLSGNATYSTAVSEAFDTTISGGGAEVVEARSVESNPVIAGGALVLDNGVVSGGIDFAGTGGKLIIDEATPPDALITGFTVADAIELATVSYTSGATVTVTGPNQVAISANGNTYTLNIAGAELVAPHFQVSEGSDGFLLLTETAPCFAAGTHILTPGGEVAVERLRVGDLVITHEGADAPVVWIGHRRLDLARHVRPASVQPIRIAADAFAEGVPSRDLVVSPDHALFVEGLLIPAKALINGRNVCQLNRPVVTYYHVELAAHGVIFADGMAVESYIETGNRGAFENGGTALILHPDFAQGLREARSCARFAETGPVVETVALRLLERHYEAVAKPRRQPPVLFRHR